MRRADRLFKIVECLHPSKITTAAQLADMLEVSQRTIYRDIQDLSSSGVPISSETGIGYKLLPGFQLPPLMFNEVELEALLLGVRMVSAWADKELADSAQHALRKIEAVLPNALKPQLDSNDILVPNIVADNPSSESAVGEQLYNIRKAIKQQKKVSFSYNRADGTESSRTIQPLGLLYWGKVWTLVAWCELRDDFRHFRLDRMKQLQLSEQHFDSTEQRTMKYYLANCINCDE